MPSFGLSRLQAASPSPSALQLVATHGEMPTAVGSMASTYSLPSARLQGQSMHYFGYRDIKRFALVFPGWAWLGGADIIPANNLPVRAAIYIPTAPIPTVRVTFEGGRKTTDVLTGAQVDEGLIIAGVAEYSSDFLTPAMFGYTGGVFPANTQFYVRTLQDILPSQQHFSTIGPGIIDAPEYNQTGRSDTMTDGTMTGTYSGALYTGAGGAYSNLWQGLKPIAIVGEPVAPMMAVGVFGDSIIQGEVGPAGPYPNVQLGGYVSNGLFNVNGNHIPWLSIAAQGTQATQWDANPGGRARTFFKYVTDILSNYGSNDLVNSKAPAVIFAAQLRNLIDAKSRAIGNRSATEALVTYRDASTDNWATIANQTVQLDPSALNALIQNAKGGVTIDDIIDAPATWTTAPAPFTPSDGTKFPVVQGQAFVATTDGTHPTVLMGRHVMAPAYKAWALKRLMTQVTQKPSNTAPPSIVGARVQGCTLLCLSGSWALAEATYQTLTYQWQRNGAAISGATSNTYTLVSADVGTTISCVLTATNALGTATATATAASSVTATWTPVAFPNPAALSGSVYASGSNGLFNLSGTGGQADPTGGTGATKIAFSTTSGLHTALLTAQMRDGNRYTASIIAKAAEYSALFMQFGVGSIVTFSYQFNLATGAIDVNLDSNVIQHPGDQADMINLGNGWYRCFITGTAQGDRNDSYALRWGPSSTLGAIGQSGAVGSGIYVFRTEIVPGWIDA